MDLVAVFSCARADIANVHDKMIMENRINTEFRSGRRRGMVG